MSVFANTWLKVSAHETVATFGRLDTFLTGQKHQNCTLIKLCTIFVYKDKPQRLCVHAQGFMNMSFLLEVRADLS